MKSSFLLSLALTAVSLNLQAETAISMGDSEIRALQITLAQPAYEPSVTSSPLPASVVLPPGREKLIGPLEPAVLQSLLVAPGDKVKQGAPLATITSPALLQLQRDLLDAHAKLRLVNSRLARDQQLADEGLIAQSRLESTKIEKELAAVELRQYESNLLLNGMSSQELALLKRTGNLKKTLSLSAPIDGTVLAIEGAPGTGLNAGDVVARVADLSKLALNIQVNTQLLPRLKMGQAVIVPERAATARIVTLPATVDAATQTAIARADVVEGAAGLHPGEVVQVRLQWEQDNLLSLPRAAVVRNEGRNYVFVRSEGGFIPRQIMLADLNGDTVAIEAGLTGDEQVAVTGIVALKGAWLGLGDGE